MAIFQWDTYPRPQLAQSLRPRGWVTQPHQKPISPPPCSFSQSWMPFCAIHSFFSWPGSKPIPSDERASCFVLRVWWWINTCSSCRPMSIHTASLVDYIQRKARLKSFITNMSWRETRCPLQRHDRACDWWWIGDFGDFITYQNQPAGVPSKIGHRGKQVLVTQIAETTLCARNSRSAHRQVSYQLLLEIGSTSIIGTCSLAHSWICGYIILREYKVVIYIWLFKITPTILLLRSRPCSRRPKHNSPKHILCKKRVVVVVLAL